MNFDKDDDLLKVLKGKKVAIVGPSPHIMGKSLGRYIDSHDIVCRVNEVSAVNYEEDYGSKTDIIFHNCSTVSMDDFSDKLKKSKNISKGLKYVICPCVKATGSDNNWHLWPDNHVSPVVNNFEKINLYNTPFYWIGISNYKKAYGTFGVEPNAGQTSILLLLQYEIESLFITGFSFYSQGDTPSKAHRPGHTDKGRENELVGNPGHPQDPQKHAFKNTVFRKYKEKIIIDSFLNNLLDLRHDRVV